MGFFSSLIGSTIGKVTDNIFAQNAADKNRDWQQWNITHAHQNEVADLRAAGLNPVLSAGGTGAAVGSGSVADTPKFGDTFSSAADTEAKKASATAAEQTAKLSAVQQALVREQIKKTAAETIGAAADARRVSAIADQEEVKKVGYTILKDLALPKIKSTAQDVADHLKKSGISIKMGDGEFQ